MPDSNRKSRIRAELEAQLYITDEDVECLFDEWEVRDRTGAERPGSDAECTAAASATECTQAPESAPASGCKLDAAARAQLPLFADWLLPDGLVYGDPTLTSLEKELLAADAANRDAVRTGEQRSKSKAPSKAASPAKPRTPPKMIYRPRGSGSLCKLQVYVSNETYETICRIARKNRMSLGSAVEWLAEGK